MLRDCNSIASDSNTMCNLQLCGKLLQCKLIYCPSIIVRVPHHDENLPKGFTGKVVVASI